MNNNRTNASGQHQTEQNQNNLAAALDYASRGFEVFPCQFGTNNPLVETGHKAATTDPDTIREWWAKWPNAVIGWRIPAGFVAVDIDFKVDPVTGDVLTDGGKSIEAKGIVMLDTPFRAVSGGGGEHRIYREPPREVAISAVNINGLKGVDTKAHSGYIIIAPSGHKSGRRYAWASTVNPRASLDELLGGVPDAHPMFLQSAVARERKARERVEELTDDLKAQLREALNHIDPVTASRDDWLKIGMALSAYTGNAQAALDLWDEWSQRDTRRYSPGEVASKWDGFHHDSTGVQIGTLLNMAKAGGWKDRRLNDSFTREREERAAARRASGGGGSDEPEYSQIDAAADFAGVHGAFAGGRLEDTGDGGEGAGEAPDGPETATPAPEMVRYCGQLGGWQWWNGSHWERDTTQNAVRLMAAMLRAKQDQFPEDRARLGSFGFTRGSLGHASARHDFAVRDTDFDRDKHLLATPGGIIDLRDGTLAASDPARLMSRCTAVTPAPTADCPAWDAFIKFAMNDDPELVRFLRQWAGYALTGDTREHVFAFFHGSGGNGKGTFLNTILDIMGSYAAQINAATLMSGANERHLTEIASLRGARFVVAPEVTEGKAWDEERIKTMSGGDKMRARFMRQDEFEFKPEFKITISGNHQPILRNVDEAMRRRLRIVPFVRVPAKKDPLLPEKLAAEAPGILRWMIDGAIDWRQNGLILPKAVSAATAQYIDDQNVFGEWLTEACEISAAEIEWFATAADLLQSFNTFLAAEGERPITARRMADKLRRAGAVSCKLPGGVRGYRLIRLKTVAETGF